MEYMSDYIAAVPTWFQWALLGSVVMWILLVGIPLWCGAAEVAIIYVCAASFVAIPLYTKILDAIGGGAWQPHYYELIMLGLIITIGLMLIASACWLAWGLWLAMRAIARWVGRMTGGVTA